MSFTLLLLKNNVLLLHLKLLHLLQILLQLLKNARTNKKLSKTFVPILYKDLVTLAIHDQLGVERLLNNLLILTGMAKETKGVKPTLSKVPLPIKRQWVLSIGISGLQL